MQAISRVMLWIGALGLLGGLIQMNGTMIVGSLGWLVVGGAIRAWSSRND